MSRGVLTYRVSRQFANKTMEEKVAGEEGVTRVVVMGNDISRSTPVFH